MIKAKDILQLIVTTLAVLAIGLSIADMVFYNAMKEPQATYTLCCNGTPCSDTYYDHNTKECVLVLSGERYQPIGMDALSDLQ